MDKKIYEEIHEALKARSTDWERRQTTYYNMRYDGLRRPVKPYPGAPDMHYALVDSMIEKLKPFYIQQIYAQNVLATFTTDEQGSDQIAGLAEKAFDKEIKQNSNFERFIHSVVDDMLLYGLGVAKVLWDTNKKRVNFICVDPMYIVVPQWTEELQDTDWLVHIIHLSEAQYRRNNLFNQDDTFVKSITGKGGEAYENKQQDIELREGITCGKSDQIVLWECYQRKGDKWVIDTISPLAGCDKPVKDQFALAYKHGELPFCDLRNELGEAGWYSARGIAAILASDEKVLCKLRNSIMQFLDFSSQPVFVRQPGSIVNTANLKTYPGALLPEGVTQAPPVEAPLDLIREMEMTRALAEDRVQIPDLGASQHLTGKPGKQGDVTATQVEAVVAQSNQGNDLRSRVFRMQLARIYRQSASLLAQYNKVDVVVEQFRIMPSGSADSWNVQARQMQATLLFQMLQGNLFVNQAELTKYMLEEAKPELVMRLFNDPQQMMMMQQMAAAAQGAPMDAPQMALPPQEPAPQPALQNV